MHYVYLSAYAYMLMCLCGCMCTCVCVCVCYELVRRGEMEIRALIQKTHQRRQGPWRIWC